ncbi:hypothetical protein KSP35_23365 [Aquihabitans sp. G128]|uniref:hypothetical protein n=1 Tax=Aquihabitans sp. G128 TaxID=2849779 RepID=UPI001C2340CB|nr:hypothetical protein [Aquihabitans sp. G128]QXC61213.1 hypothetical protein KSP35_23365 [Aquihabitans sp. G128]
MSMLVLAGCGPTHYVRVGPGFSGTVYNDGHACKVYYEEFRTARSVVRHVERNSGYDNGCVPNFTVERIECEYRSETGAGGTRWFDGSVCDRIISPGIAAFVKVVGIEVSGGMA